MKNIKICPSIISGDFADMKNCIKFVEDVGGNCIHADVMDGVFVPNITFGMPMIKAIRPLTKLPIDTHLMIVEPEKYIAKFIESGSDMVSFHISASKNPHKAIELIKREGKSAGVVLNPDEPVSMLKEFIKEVDFVLIMGVFPGFSGQKLIEEVKIKLPQVSEMISKYNPNAFLEFDGGVTEDNAQTLIDLGCDMLVGGSSVFNSADPRTTIKKLRGDLK